MFTEAYRSPESREGVVSGYKSINHLLPFCRLTTPETPLLTENFDLTYDKLNKDVIISREHSEKLSDNDT
jgi:hypothetical protein